jgi:pimeloyl-ACP methyl ester carboxylesterase
MAAGDFDVLGPLAYGHGEFEIHGLAGGFYLSIYCSEDVPFIDPAEVEAATAGTFYGDGRIRAQIEACRRWPRGVVPEGFLQPVRSDVPVLLVSGAWDPASPPRHAERAGRDLTNSRHVVLPFAGHGPGGIVGGMECFDRLSNEFVLRGTVEDLDTSCVEKLRRPPFVLDLDGPP